MEQRREKSHRSALPPQSIDGFSKRRNARPMSYANPADLSKTPASTDTIFAMPSEVPPTRKKRRGRAPRPVLTDISLPPVVIPVEPLLSEPEKSKNDTLKKKLTKKKVIKRVLLVLALLIIGLGGFVGVRGINTIDKVFHGNIFSDVKAAFSDTPLKGESNGRVNILLAGDSSDQIGHGGADLTDSILILSIDTKTHTAFLLSIPRDLWVDIPGYGWQKINAANNDLGTNFAGYPQNGMGQLEHIVATDLGIPIDYYALADYGAFEDAVDAVGGVTIDIQSPDPYGLYDPNTDLKLPNGSVTLNGQEALNLARARGDGYGSYGFPDSDFDRTEHQRQLFTAVAQKAKTIGVLSNPVKISDLFNAFSKNVETNLSLQNVLRLVQITKGVNISALKSYAYCSTLSIGQDGCTTPILTTYTNPSSGEDVLVPSAGIGQYGQLKQYYEQLTSANPVVKEGASVVVLNASDVDGLAKQQEGVLESKGVDVSTIADANNEHLTTMIVNSSGGKMPDTLVLLQKLYSGSTVTSDTGSSEADEAQGYTADFVVILGQNWDSTAVGSNTGSDTGSYDASNTGSASQ
jgi:LCP family protein required for cell wall assembly